MQSALVRNNNWREINAIDSNNFIPNEKITIVIPYYNAPEKLEFVLNALEHQTYPKELTEIIISADYPDPTLPFEKIGAHVRVIRQPHIGFGVGRARNAAAKVAIGDILVFFDGDIIPSAKCVEEHARWHHSASNIITIGDRGFINPEHIRIEQVPELIKYDIDIHVEKSDHKDLIDLTDEFTQYSDIVYQGVIGHNFGIRRDWYLKIGGNREESNYWGMEDTEFGYRAYINGLIIVFVKEAYTWHLGVQDYKHNPEKIFGLHMQSALMEQYIPDYRFRNASKGRSFTIPEHVVNIVSKNSDVIIKSIVDILACDPHDLIIRVDLDFIDKDEALYIRCRFEGDFRVVFGKDCHSLIDYPCSPIHIYLDINCFVVHNIIKFLINKLRNNAAVVSYDNNVCKIKVVRTWAANRSLQCNCNIDDIGEVEIIPSKYCISKRNTYSFNTSATYLYKARMLLRHASTISDIKRIVLHRIRIILSTISKK